MNNESELIDIKALCDMLSVKPQTIRRWWRSGQMPAPRRLGRRVIRWYRAEIEDWLTESAAKPKGTTSKPKGTTSPPLVDEDTEARILAITDEYRREAS